MKRKLSIRLTENDIKTVKDYISNIYIHDIIERKLSEVLYELAELGRETAETVYGSRGINVNVETVESGKRLVITASGHHICFLEFGAGTTTYTDHPFADEMPFDVIPGSWSVQDKQQFYTWGYWYFGSAKLTHVTPRPGMYEADKKIQQDVGRIARKVFGND